MSQPAAKPSVDDLITVHRPVVGQLVREMLARVPAHVRREDLFCAGSEALVVAARSFDPECGTPFGAFATLRIRGALLDELRELDWASRSRDKVRKLETAGDEFVTEHGRVPTIAELAARVDTDAREGAAAYDDVQRATLLSLQAAFSEELIVDRARTGHLRDAIDALPERLRTVVAAYCVHNRPVADLARDHAETESGIDMVA